MNKTIEDLSINIEYTFSSYLGDVDEGRYIKEVKAIVYNGECADNKENELIGEMDFKLLNLEQAKEDGFWIYQIFDYYEYTFRHGQSFYNFQKNDFRKELYSHYNDNLFNENICIIERMGLLPEYRGLGLGPRLFKDLVYHFKNHSALFMLQPYPLQFELVEKKGIELGLETFEKNKAKAFKKLRAYYESWGLEKIKGIKDLLFYNAEVINEKFDNISLED